MRLFSLLPRAIAGLIICGALADVAVAQYPNLACYTAGGQAECTAPIATHPWNCQASVAALVDSEPQCPNATGCPTEQEALTAFSTNYRALLPQTCAGPTVTSTQTYITQSLGIDTEILHGDAWTVTYLDSHNACTEVENLPCADNDCLVAYCKRQVECPPTFTPDATNTYCYRIPVCPTCNGGAPPSVGNPIQPAGGEKTLTETDIQGSGGSPLSFVRYYNSNGLHTPVGAEHDTTVLGALWHHTYQRSILLEQGVSPNVTVAYAIRPEGDFRYFVASGSTWTPASDAPERLTSTVNGSGQITSWQYTTAEDTVETYSSTGQLLTITPRSGRVQTLTYSTASTPPSIAPVAGLLIQVADDSGRTLQLVYNADSSLSQVKDPIGNITGYRYDTVGNLGYVDYPSSGTRTYANNETKNLPSSITTEGLVTGISDENGNRYANYTYDAYAGRYGIATASWHGAQTDVIDKVSLMYTFANGYASSAVVTDALGNVSTRNFSAANGHVKDSGVKRCLSSSGCASFVTTSIHYDSAGYLASKTDYNSNLTTYTFDDTRGIETQRVEASGTTSQRTIITTPDTNFHLPDQITVENASNAPESLRKWTYNSRGQVLSRCEIDPGVSGASAYVCGNAANAPAGVRQWTYTYCEQPAITAGTCPLLGLVLTVDGPRTDVIDKTTYTYYQTTDVSHCTTLGGACHFKGDLQTISNALNQITTYVSYDQAGRPTRIKDANGTYVDMTYHARGWLLTRIVRANADGSPNAPLDAATTFTYDNVGNVKQITQPDGVYLKFSYDNAHRLTDVYDNLNDHLQYTLDAVGNRTKESTYDPSPTLTRALTRQYDQLNHLETISNHAAQAVQSFTNPTGAPATYVNGYDPDGNAIYSVDGSATPVGTEQLYDPLNRLMKTLQDHAGTGTTANTTTQYAYDTRDNLRSVIDPDNVTTTYSYDGLNNLTSLVSHDTGTTTYQNSDGSSGYDAAGNRLRETDARGIVKTYAYDALNRLRSVTYPTVGLSISYTFDEAFSGCYNVGRLTTMVDHSGTTYYCYDRRGNLLSKTQNTADGSGSFNEQYGYSLGDRLLSATYPSGGRVNYTRDTGGRITGITYTPAGSTTAISVVNSATYYPFGPLNALPFGNGRTLTKTYDKDYAIDQIVSSNNTGLVIDATVDVLGNVINASSSVGSSPATQTYLYDPLYRLTTVENSSLTSVEAFTYNNTGDRLTKAVSGQSTQTYGYTNPLTTHQLQSVAGAIRTYDANGNTTQLNGLTLTYDDRNRMIASGTTTFDYNGSGERVNNAHPSSMPVLNALVGSTWFVYQQDGALSSELAAYWECGVATFIVHGSEPSNTGLPAQCPSGQSLVPTWKLGADYIYLDGVPVAVFLPHAGPPYQGILYYIETDQLGSPRQVIQPGSTSANDVLVWKWDYFSNTSAFGENTPSLQTITFNLRFPGQYFDSETGLNYNYFRDYESSTGRYIESDPIGLAGGADTYSYTGANPLLAIDMRGTDFWVDNGTSVAGLHQSVCVGKPWKANFCISYGADSVCCGLLGAHGSVYVDRGAGNDPDVSHYRLSDSEVDAKIENYLNSLVDSGGGYGLFYNCRDFSQELFKKLFTFGPSTYGPPPKGPNLKRN